MYARVVSKTLHYYLIAPLAYTAQHWEGFTYHCSLDISIGSIVKIPLGKRATFGIVIAISEKPAFPTREVISPLPFAPLPEHLPALAEWMSRYYFASPSSVWQTILPAGVAKTRQPTKPDGLELKLPRTDFKLTPSQQQVVKNITDSNKRTHLLRGVTGSGKTEIYLELAKSTLASGRSVIVLVPEIALAPQLVARFENVFGKIVTATHSKLSESQRHQIWQKILALQTPCIVIGPRSALFSPIAKVGMIIIDESHESSYKQEQNPRYHAVATAAKLTELTSAKLILGSATPSLDQALLAKVDRINPLELPEKISQQETTTTIVDMKDKSELQKSAVLSRTLISALSDTLKNKRQALLFLNRRGSATSHLCANCGQVTVCPNCQIPLTFHQDLAALLCHYCNHKLAPEAICPKCGESDMRYIGTGTKKVESEIIRLFPKARVARIDKDNSKLTHLYQVYDDLAKGKLDILIGTQMIAKGLDLPLIDTVGIVMADSTLMIPDFTASERTYQLATQASGRGGRGLHPATTVIQTLNPAHPAILAAAKNDFWNFAEAELAERKLVNYPPYVYLIKLEVAASTKDKAQAQAGEVLKKMQAIKQIQWLGPAPSFREVRAGKFHWQLIGKSKIRANLLQAAELVGTLASVDLDPINLL